MARLKKNERREQIIRSATRVFAERGLAGTRTREIAEAAGINEALIYKHFTSKEELFRETMDQLHTDMVAVWKSIAAESPDAYSALKAIFESQINMIYKSPMVSAGMLQGFAASVWDKDVKDNVKGYFTGQHEFLAGIIKQGIEDGSLKPGIDPIRTAWWLRGISWSSILASCLGDLECLGCEESLKNLNALLEMVCNTEKSSGEDGDSGRERE